MQNAAGRGPVPQHPIKVTRASLSLESSLHPRALTVAAVVATSAQLKVSQRQGEQEAAMVYMSIWRDTWPSTLPLALLLLK